MRLRNLRFFPVKLTSPWLQAGVGCIATYFLFRELDFGNWKHVFYSIGLVSLVMGIVVMLLNKFVFKQNRVLIYLGGLLMNWYLMTFIISQLSKGQDAS